ncbi:MAG TPA: hypothetical protein VI391_07160 [Thermoanaerobaculia bacterium]
MKVFWQTGPMRHVLVFAILLFSAAAADRTPTAQWILREYVSSNDSERQNSPADYVAFLKRSRFTRGELDRLPANAIVVYAEPISLLHDIGFTDAEIGKPLKLGTSDPTVLFVIRPRNGAAFMLEQGLPGGGGISTQTAELIALGARRVIHVGTCAVLSKFASNGEVITATASYKDAAAILLSSGAADKIPALASSDRELTRIIQEQLTKQGTRFVEGCGFTLPIYYFESTALIRDLVAGPWTPRPNYIEMEEAAFFETAHRMGASAASVTVGSDRYEVTHGTLVHTFPTQSTDRALRAAVAAAAHAL